MTVDQEILESIKKNLPQQVGEVLKDRLETADADAEKVTELRGTIERINRTRDELTAEVEQLTKRLGDIEKREREATEREQRLDDATRRMEQDRLRTELDAERRISRNLINYTALLAGNSAFNGDAISRNITTSQDGDLNVNVTGGWTKAPEGVLTGRGSYAVRGYEGDDYPTTYHDPHGVACYSYIKLPE